MRAGAGQEGAPALRVHAVEAFQLPQARAPAPAAPGAAVPVPAVLRRRVAAARRPRAGEEGHLPVRRGVLLGGRRRPGRYGRGGSEAVSVVELGVDAAGSRWRGGGARRGGDEADRGLLLLLMVVVAGKGRGGEGARRRWSVGG